MRLRTTILITLLASLSAGAWAQTQPVTLQSGDMTLTVGKGRLTRLTVRGATVIRESAIYIVHPGWSNVWLNQDTMTPILSHWETGGAKVLTAVYDNRQAYARYRYEMKPGNTLIVRLEYGTRGQKAEMQFNAAFLSAPLISGRPFTAQTVDGPRAGTVPLAATSSDQEKSMLTPHIRRISLETAVGPMTIAVEGSHPGNNDTLALFDARRGTQSWAKTHPIFWLGVGVPKIQDATGDRWLQITYSFGPAPIRPATPEKTVTATAHAIQRAVVPAGPDLPLIPKPKEARFSGSPFRLTGKPPIVLLDNASPEEIQAARDLQYELKTFWHIQVPVVRRSALGIKEPRGIYLRRFGFGPPDAQVASSTPQHTEGYFLRVSQERVDVVGRDARGVYHGSQTLRQLLRADDDGVSLAGVTIKDWPTLAFRGVHWFGGPKSWPFHRKMIDRVIAPLKFNAMVYETQYAQWESQPKIWVDRSTPKADVKRTVDYARRHFLEPIPLITGFGHTDWMFENKQNMDVVADPARPTTYNPTKPRAYDILFGVYEEAIDLFQPKTLHIGHDEVGLDSKFPPEGVDKTVTELLVEDVNKIHAWLKDRNIRTMMWGDQLLAPSEGSGGAAFAPNEDESKKRREGIPKDIVIADWHYNYGGEPQYPSVPILQKAGFDVIGTPWYLWANVKDFAGVLANNKSAGMLQSTWAGWLMSPEIVLGQEFPQFVAYLLAAEHAWNGGSNDFDAMEYSPESAFLALWMREPIRKESRPGFTLRLQAGTSPAPFVQVLSPGKRVLGGTVFDLSAPIVLKGALNPAGTWPESVQIPVGRKAAELHFLWGATEPIDYGAAMGRLSVVFADGSGVEERLFYGRQVHAFTDLRGSHEIDVVWRGRARDGRRADLRRWIWRNPHPDKIITRVTLASDGTEAAPVLLGITGVE